MTVNRPARVATSSFLRTAGLVAFAAMPLAVACSVVETKTSDDAIITGSNDTGHPAVVTLEMQLANGFALCTGTMIATNPATKIGYVLTAGHCVRDAKSVYVAAGNDLSAKKGILTYGVIDFKAHPQYDGEVSSPYDVAMVRVTGVDATTPTMPYAKPDGLVLNQTRVTSVGFGQTIRPGIDAGSADDGTIKNKIDGTVTKLSEAQVAVTYDDEGDICHGDSGGPVIAKVNGKDAVVAVHSFVTGACEGAGYSVRASFHDGFIKSILAEDAPAPSCGLCKQTVGSGTGVCAQARDTCTDDAQCDGLRTCLAKCTQDGGDAGASSTCKTACSTQFPFGAAPYNTLLVFCACNACDDACSGDTTCAALPKCGMTLTPPPASTPSAAPVATDSAAAARCNSCGESACCSEMSACGQDGHCYRCTKNPETPGCDTNELYQRLNSCRSTSCATQCAPTVAAGTP